LINPGFANLCADAPGVTFIVNKDAYECGHLLQVSNLKIGNLITLLSDVIIVSIEVQLDRGDDEEMLNYFVQVTESDGMFVYT
jgi:hypothetical protein